MVSGLPVYLTLLLMHNSCQLAKNLDSTRGNSEKHAQLSQAVLLK